MRWLAALIGLASLAVAWPGSPEASASQAPSPPAAAIRGAAPQVVIEAPRELDQVRARFESFDFDRLAGIMQLVGLEDPGPPIHVILASERSSYAERVPDWVAGMAFGAAGPVLIFPDRASTYPYETLENVLRHEVAHVLIARAAGGRPVPRWFHEGLAMAAERTWNLEDRTRLVYELTLSRQTGHAELDRLFAGGRRAQLRAYALSGALARDLIDRHGASTPGAILGGVAAGASFESAFIRATGTTLAETETAFWRRQRIWTTWVPFLTSTTALWMVVTMLGMYAMRRRRQQRTEQRERWAVEEEMAEATSNQQRVRGDE